MVTALIPFPRRALHHCRPMKVLDLRFRGIFGTGCEFPNQEVEISIKEFFFLGGGVFFVKF